MLDDTHSSSTPMAAEKQNEKKVTPRSQDFAGWYNDVILRAELADYSPVRGSMVFRPDGFGIWELLRDELDRRIKKTGARNAYFPMFIPQSLLDKEAQHVEGFAPEVAVVTHGGGKLLEEPLIVRPTSETIINHMFAQWIHSHRDLPMMVNQWCNVVRWEMRTRLFLRTLEFLWQEGHTAHATREEAERETLTMLEVYRTFVEEFLAIPLIVGRKSAAERFPGAEETYTIEGLMADGRALQCGTSHFLGQNFAKAFEIRYLDQAGALQHCWTTSWGLSTRFIGAIIMVHGDDQGLILPPRIAPYQIVIVPIFKNDEEKALVLEAAKKIREQLIKANIRVKVDEREGQSPGFKFNDWEMRGVPLRMEIGPKDVAKGSVVLARRDRPGKEGKSFVSQEGVAESVEQQLTSIQKALFDRALVFRNTHTFEPKTVDEFAQVVEQGFARSYWCGDAKCEEQIKETTKATLRCIPMEQHAGTGACLFCGKPSKEVAIFGKAY
jgi:prolyl-tRNA synthetase